MASQTPNLGLILPANGEFTGTWDVPVNANMTAIDTAVGTLQDEMSAAAGNLPNLAARLALVVDANGNPLPTPEISAARVSPVYGAQASLDARIEGIDFEVFAGRQGLSSLAAAMAWGNSSHTGDSVVSAPSGYLTFTGNVVYVNGSVTPVVADINGYRQVVSTQISTTLIGAAGTYYVYLTRNPSGQVVLDRTGVGQNTGTVTVDLSSNITVLNDVSQNFVTENIEPGQLLQITSVGSQNIGTYVIASVGYNSNPNNLQITGTFPIVQGALNYKIVDPIAPSMSVSATPPANRFSAISNQICIGTLVFDGTNVTSITAFATQGHYEGFTSVTLIGGMYSLTIPHNIGYQPTHIQIFATQASDFSQMLERMSDGSMTASSTLCRNVISAMDKNNVYITNPTSGVFYTNFASVAQTSGFVFVIVDR